jgi:LysM repeat protein
MTVVRQIAPECPYLGVVDDPASHFSFPEPSQRCAATRKPSRINLSYQTNFCLSERHVECPRYRSAAGPLPVWAAVATLAVSDEPKQIRGQRHRTAPRGKRRVATVVVLAAAIIAPTTYIALAQGRISPLTAVAPYPTPGSATLALTTSPSAPPTPSLVPVQTVTPSPAPTPTLVIPSITPVPTTIPLPPPSRSPLVHVVQQGETLIEIAAQYGVSVAEIAALNSLRNPSLIHTGQTLLIP